MKKRILIIVQNLPVPFDRRVWQEAKTLANAGYAVSVICPKAKGCVASYERIDGVDIHRHPQWFEAKGKAGYLLEYSSSLIFEFLLSLKLFFTSGFDAIHACNPPDTIFLIGGFYKLLGKKFVFDHHDLNPELYEAKFGKQGFGYKALKWCERLTFFAADVSIATNESYREIAITRGRMSPENVFVVRSGPTLDMQAVAHVAALRHGGKYLVGYVGIMGSQEGLHYLLEAARIIVRDKKRDDVQFILVGEGSELPKLRTMAKDKNIEGFVTLTGRLHDAQLLEALSTSDVCVNPDEVNKLNDLSTMNKILEYMCLEKPIVQFDLKEGRVSAGEASLYAKANDAQDFAEKILSLLADAPLRKKMGTIGRTRMEESLAWEHQAPKLLAAYAQLFAMPSWMDNVPWYYHRLRAMSLSEIFFRFQEKARRLYDGQRKVVFENTDEGPLPELPGLKADVEAWEMPEQFGVAQQQDFVNGSLTLLGQAWPKCWPGEKWHIDPTTGQHWYKDGFCYDINYRHAPKFGDVKYVWELNRLQYLQPLAARAFKQHDTVLAKAIWAEVESWIDNNPPYKGINWASGIELSLRLLSFFVVTTLLSEYATDAQRGKIWATIKAHSYWLKRYPSRFSSGNNHKAAEALGLLMIGSSATALPESERLKREGWRRLSKCAEKLIWPDGVGAEQALSYTAFTLELFKLGLKLARKNQFPVPKVYTARMQSAALCLQWFTDCKGHRPMIGDDDEGKVLIWNSAYEVTPTQAVVLGQDSRLRGNNNRLDGLKTFSDGGYSVIRYPVHEKEILLVLDHGPLGFGSIAAHGHADALAVWLHVAGEPVLIDAGTYLYHSDEQARDYFRSTQAHNTLAVEGTSSSITAGNFNWSHKANARLHEVTAGRNIWQVSGEHDGFKKRYGVTHQRNVTAQNAGFKVEDMLLGSTPWAVAIGFLVHPSFEVRESGISVEIVKGDEVVLRVRHESPLTQSIEEGWYAEKFGHKIPAKRIVFRGILEPEQSVVTEFYFA